jgi:hypothetical protein
VWELNCAGLLSLRVASAAVVVISLSPHTEYPPGTNTENRIPYFNPK